MQGLFSEPLRFLVLVGQTFLNCPGLFLIANRFALVQGMATGKLLLLGAFLKINEFLRLGLLALL